MKVLVVLSALVAFAAAAALTPSELALLEAFDYDILLANDHLRNKMFDCLLGKGDCGAYKTVTELSLRAMVNQCAECSPSQKTKYDSLLKQTRENYAPFYNELMKILATRKE